MKTPIELGNKFRDRIATQYPPLAKEEIPEGYTTLPQEYKKDQIEKYHVVFWHRLLRSIYQVPLEIECEFRSKGNEEENQTESLLLRRTETPNNWETTGVDETFLSKLQTGDIRPFPVNWKYLIRLPSRGILEIGTNDKHTVFHLAHVTESGHINENDRVEATKFIDLVLDEANRLKGQLFNPMNEFKRGLGLRFYSLFNVYLSNYLSAQTMLDVAESEEMRLRGEFVRYDARTSDLYDEEKRQHIDQHMLMCGTFYSSAIAYFFMALEGFVNLAFHAFLKTECRDKDFRIERLDLEQKIRFMPSICKGFLGDADFLSTILPEFKTLRNHRNIVFHSKVEDSLKGLCFVEDGFVYNYDVEAQKSTVLPSMKLHLTLEDVTEAKRIVDEIIESILKSMNHDTRMLVEDSILSDAFIFFTVSETGEVTLGTKRPA